MYHEPNTHHWQPGDLVIHDADRKSSHMLMKVIGYTRDGLVKTRYISHGSPRKVWINEPRYLHDPSRFGIVGRG